MNVKPGDLARIIQVDGDPIDPCAGMLVVVDEYLGDKCLFNGEQRLQCWKVTSLGPLFPWGDMMASCEDRALRPVPGIKDGDESRTETILVAGKPMEAVMAVLS